MKCFRAEYLLTEASVTGQGNAGSPQRGRANIRAASKVAPQILYLPLHKVTLVRGQFLFYPCTAKMRGRYDETIKRTMA